MRTFEFGPEDVPKVCHTTARFLVIAAPRPSGYQTWMNPGGTNRGALFLWSGSMLRKRLRQLARNFGRQVLPPSVPSQPTILLMQYA